MIGSTLFGPGYYHTLSTQEVEKIQRIEAQINSKKFKDKFAAIQSLQALSHEDVVRFTKDNPTLWHFCETNEVLRGTWIETLKSHHKTSPIHSIESLHGTREKHPVFHHYVSAYLLNAYIGYEHVMTTPIKQRAESPALKAKVENLLNVACDLGSYYALVKRCQLHCQKLESEEKNASVDLISADAIRLADLYGAIGHLQAGNMRFELSVYFHQENPDLERAAAYFEQGIKSYLCALILNNSHPYSQRLIERLTAGGGLASAFSADEETAEFAAAFKEDATARKLLATCVSPDTYQKLLGEATREVAPILSRVAAPLVMKAGKS